MKQATLLYALSVLDYQYLHCAGRNEEQRAYYDGMKNMLDIIVSDALMSDFCVCKDNTGKHFTRGGGVK